MVKVVVQCKNSTNVLVYKRTSGWKIKMVNFYNFLVLLIKRSVKHIIYLIKKLNQTELHFCRLLFTKSFMIFSNFKHKINPRALCGIMLRVFKNYNARISHERGTRPAYVIPVSRPKIGPDACCTVLIVYL